MNAKSKIAVYSMVIGIVCFINLLGIEKALLAIVAGWIGLREIETEDKLGKNFAYAGIILGCAYIITVITLGIFYGPQLIDYMKKIKG